jgi:hypothetical protein
MTSLEEHAKKIKEHLRVIDDAINQGAENNPVTIGFHCSACSVQFLELYLHIKTLIPIGKIIKHDWFKKPQIGQKIETLIERKLNVDFPEKQEIYNLIYSLEEDRTSLVYGHPSKEQITNVLIMFNKIKEIFRRLFEDEGFEIK